MGNILLISISHTSLSKQAKNYTPARLPYLLEADETTPPQQQELHHPALIKSCDPPSFSPSWEHFSS